MIVVEFLEDNPFAVVIFMLVALLIIGICSGDTTTKQKVEIDATEATVATVPTPTVADIADLTSLHVLGTHSSVLDNRRDGSVQDAYGNTYQGPYFELCSFGNYVDEIDVEAYVDIVTGGHYQYLTGTYFCRPGQPEDFSIEFFVFADDRLVYSSGAMTRRDKPVSFTVDIGSCDVLRIKSSSTDYTSYGTNPGIILVDAVVD